MTGINAPAVFGATLVDSWHSPAMGGGGIVVEFPNGWGVSIVRHRGSYGGPERLFEAMAIDKHGDLFGDPAGWLTVADVDLFCEGVAAR